MVSEVESTGSLGLAKGNQRSVFRNPRGLQNYYMLYIDSSNNLVAEYSTDGTTWSNSVQTVYTGTVQSFDLKIRDTGSLLDVYVVFFDSAAGDLTYIRGTIADASNTISWDSAQDIDSAIVTETGMAAAHSCAITRTDNGRLVVGYTEDKEVVSADSNEVDSTGGLGLAKGNQRATFRNPRGLKNYYSLYIDGSNNLVAEYSTDGSTWSNTVQTVYTGTVESFDVKIRDTGTDLDVFLILFDSAADDLTYIKGDLADASNTISWNSAQDIDAAIATETGMAAAHSVAITRTDNGRLVVAFTEDTTGLAPTTTQVDPSATYQLPKNKGNNRQVFQNPRGTKCYYIFYVDSSTADLYYEYSTDGTTWTNTEISVYTGFVRAFDVKIYDTGSLLDVYVVLQDGGDEDLTYIKGTISDASNTISWNSAQDIDAAINYETDPDNLMSCAITRTANGRLVVAFTEDYRARGKDYRVVTLIGADGDGTAPSWSGEVVIDDPSTDTNNDGKDQVWVGLESFSSSYGDRVLVYARCPEGTNASNYQMKLFVYDWAGSSFSSVTSDTGVADASGANLISAIIDDSDKVHVIGENLSATSKELEHLFYPTAGSLGTETAYDVATAACDACTLVIDRTNDDLYAFYHHTADSTDYHYKMSDAATISWGGEETITVSADMAILSSWSEFVESSYHVASTTSGNRTYITSLFVSEYYRQVKLIGADGDGAAPSWSGEETIVDPTANSNNDGKDQVWVGLESYSSSYPNRVFLYCRTPESTSAATYQYEGFVYDWAGVSFSSVTSDSEGSDADYAKVISAIIDDTDNVHVLLYTDSTNYLRHKDYPTAGSLGAETNYQVKNADVDACTLVIDRTNDKLIAFYHDVADSTSFHAKTTLISTVSWGDEQTIILAADVTELTAWSEDIESRLHVVTHSVAITYHECLRGVYRATYLIGADGDGAAPTWNTAQITTPNDPSNQTNNHTKDQIWLGLESYSSSYGDRILLYQRIPNAADTTAYTAALFVYDWTTSFSNITSDTQAGVYSEEGKVLSAIIDDSDKVHFLWYSPDGLSLYHVAYPTAGSLGTESEYTVKANDVDACTLTLDRTNDNLYAFYHDVADSQNYHYKMTDASTISWGSEQTRTVAQDIIALTSWNSDVLSSLHVGSGK